MSVSRESEDRREAHCVTCCCRLGIAACEDEGSIRNLTSFQSVPNDVRQLEFNAVQSSVVLAMVDNGVNPITPVTAPTNDMGAFPDTTWTDGTRVTAPDKPGLLLYDHDLIKTMG